MAAPWDPPPGGELIAALLVAIWLVMTVWAMVRAVGDRRARHEAERWGLRLHALLESTPQAYLVIEPSGRLRASDLLRRWLGLPAVIETMNDLAPHGEEPVSGLAGPDFDALASDIVGLKAAGQPFSRTVQTEDGSRILSVHGSTLSSAALKQMKGEGEPLALWFIDITKSWQQGSEMALQQRQLVADVDVTSALIELAPFPIWQRDPDLALAHVNTAYVRATDARNAAQVIAEQRELLSGEPEQAKALSRLVQATNELQSRTARIVTSGQQRSYRLFELPLGTAGIAGFAVDVSDAETARAELAQFNRAQGEMLNALSVPVVIFGPDQQMQFSNSAFERLFAFDPAWLAQRRTLGELLDHLRERRQLPEQANYRDWRQALIESHGKRAASVDLWHLPDDRTLRVITQPHPLGGAQMFFEDVTRELMLERNISTLSKVQAVTLNNLHEGVALLLQNGRLRLSNIVFADILGADADWLASGEPALDDVIARSTRLKGPERARLRTLVLRTVQDRQPVREELELDDDRVIRFSGSPLPDASALISLTDVTDSRVRERSLEQSRDALAARTRFLENSSYELRTPLTSISGFAQLLEQGIHGPLNARQSGYVGNILDATRSLDGMISDLLDLAMLGSGTTALDPEVTDPQALLLEVITKARHDHGGTNIRIELGSGPAVHDLRLDRARMRQALLRVIGLAAQRQPARIMIDWKKDTDAFVFCIEDDGKAIAEAERTSLFDFFHRTGSGAASLGLSLVRQIMEAHGGSATAGVSSAGQTLICLRLPLPQAPVTSLFS